MKNTPLPGHAVRGRRYIWSSMRRSGVPGNALAEVFADQRGARALNLFHRGGGFMRMRLTMPNAAHSRWLLAGRSAAGAVLLAVTVSACTAGGAAIPPPTPATPPPPPAAAPPA